MQRGLLGRSPGLDGVGSILDEEGGGKGVPTENGQVEEAVSLRVQAVQVTLVADEGVGDALVAI